MGSHEIIPTHLKSQYLPIIKYYALKVGTYYLHAIDLSKAKFF